METKVEKKTTYKKVSSADDKHGHFTKKKWKTGDLVLLVNEVESMSPGTLGKIASIQFDGAVFSVEILIGPRNGETFRIKASDLKLQPIAKAELAEKEGD